jgi:hypothetical protein
MINWSTIIVSFVSFLLGLLGNLYVQWLGDRKRLHRIKGALKLHLGDIILKECVTLKLEFEKVIENIRQLNREGLDYKSCKTFDAEIYKANNPSDYYKIYKSDNNKFEKLISAYTIISYLKENLPSKVHEDYLIAVDRDLYEPINQGISLNELFRTSGIFINMRNSYIGKCERLINEIDVLTKLIKEFIK